MAPTSNSTHYVCPNCGGNLQWNIRKQAFECVSCHSPGNIDLNAKPIEQHPIASFAERAASSQSYPDEGFAVCQNCGAQITFADNQTAAVCPMCGSPQINAAKQVAGVPPDGVVPFKVDKADAQQAFKKWVTSRWFAPNKLKESYQQGKLDGLYLPFWTYDSDSEADYHGEGGNYVEEEDDEGHTTTRTDWYPVSGYVSTHVDDLIIYDGSQKAGEVLDDGANSYDTEGDAHPYDPAYLAGVGAEHYGQGADACFERAKTVIEGELRGLADQDIRNKGYDTANVEHMNVRHNNVEYKHMLLPVWLSAFAYKGKQYTYTINGETGEVRGKRPYSVPKIIAAVLAGLLVLFLLYNVFSKKANAQAYVYPQTTVTAIVLQEEAAFAGIPDSAAVPCWTAAA
jgi:predicted RNA-binding Zn-ribbon protein involved in translation (DUF1610 family)